MAILSIVKYLSPKDVHECLQEEEHLQENIRPLTECLSVYNLSLHENKEKDPIASIPAVSALSIFDPSDIPMKKSGYLAQ
mmetsp:Transcript_30210/g.46221  ORF Transcript_30210/g.46221 Transcript_30210/m.46221 type:complete len:80 (-) Transcript_30210:1190-1429(-)